ncbi:MAG: hypothetical protein ABIM21_05115 [candidate division WOR-3 bacterium]
MQKRFLLICGTLGIVIGTVVVAIFLIQSKAKPQLNLKLFIGNISKFGGNATCANVVIPYFANLTFNGKKIADGEVYVRLTDNDGKDLGKVTLYYNPLDGVWSSAVMYPCLKHGNYYVFGEAIAAINGQELHANEMREIGV